ncbi:MAG: hypothetical protein M1813_009598 [Trichoglossum hirsutum]|nr:MAG: hypothetical protein M1813_009598 [Trichoglossum hirsutum]
MFIKTIISVSLLVLSASFASATTPPACLLAAVSAQGISPADLAALCGSKSSDVQSSIAKLCGSDVPTALSSYSDTCKAAGSAISTVISATSGSPTATLVPLPSETYASNLLVRHSSPAARILFDQRDPMTLITERVYAISMHLLTFIYPSSGSSGFSTATKSGSPSGSGNSGYASPTGSAAPGSGMSLQPALVLVYSFAVIGISVASQLLV